MNRNCSFIKIMAGYAWQILMIVFLSILELFPVVAEAQLRAGVAKEDITDRLAGPASDTLFVKALALDDGSQKLVIVTLDVVAIEEIGPIKNGYLDKVRTQIQKELNIPPSHILVNASHCHGRVSADVAELTIRAVKNACSGMARVNAGVGVGYEDRIMENRRFKMKDGTQTDMRRAYSLPADEEIAAIGPVDTEIGILRLDKMNGQALAVVYNFAVHPIEGTPDGGNTADLSGYASKTIEDNLDPGAMAFFLQGCGGDINPIKYKDVNDPPNAEQLGNMLGLSALKALKKITPSKTGKIKLINETMDLPRANFAERIDSMEAYQLRLMRSLRGTNMNLKTYVSSLVKYNYTSSYPSFYAHRYLHENMMGRHDMKLLDSLNRKDMENYKKNIYTMEEITRTNENLNLLRKHQAAAAGRKTINVELMAIRIGDFALTTFPGELTVQIGLNIKKASDLPFTFVAGYTNGYIYYAPTAEQLRNTGGAQEDCDTNLAPEWQKLYEARALELLKRL